MHGMPKSNISDRVLVFISNFCQEFFKLYGTKLQLSFAYPLQTDGQSEVVNKGLKQYLLYLHCFAHQ